MGIAETGISDGSYPPEQDASIRPGMCGLTPPGMVSFSSLELVFTKIQNRETSAIEGILGLICPDHGHSNYPKG